MILAMGDAFTQALEDTLEKFLASHIIMMFGLAFRAHHRLDAVYTSIQEQESLKSSGLLRESK